MKRNMMMRRKTRNKIKRKTRIKEMMMMRRKTRKKKKRKTRMK